VTCQFPFLFFILIFFVIASAAKQSPVLSITGHRQQPQTSSVQVAQQPNQPRLVGADTEERRLRALAEQRHLEWAGFAQLFLVQLSRQLDLVIAGIFHIRMLLSNRSPVAMFQSYPPKAQYGSHEDVIRLPKKMGFFYN
jgi:hypothetical protein